MQTATDHTPNEALGDLISLTLKGEATVYLMKLRRLMTELSPSDRTEVVARTREMLVLLGHAA